MSDILREPFGSLDGQPVELLTLRNDQGWSVSVCPFGAALVRVCVPDKNGELADVVLGFDSVESYVTDPHYVGRVVGRIANRIAGSEFELDGETFSFPPNEGESLLHGGPEGLHQVLFETEVVSESPPAVRFRYQSPHMEGGFPGEVNVSVLYCWEDDGTLKVVMEAESDRATLLNFTHHAYWNLKGHGEGDVLDHELQLAASDYLEVDAAKIPTGQKLSCRLSPMDFRFRRALGFALPLVEGGYDHTLMLDKGVGPLTQGALLKDPESGRTLTLWTNQPAILLYSGNGLDERVIGKGERPYGQYGGVCLEAQAPPDAMHHEDFPSIRVEPGKSYRHQTYFCFFLS